MNNICSFVAEITPYVPKSKSFGAPRRHWTPGLQRRLRRR